MRELIFLKAQNMIVESKEVELPSQEVFLIKYIVDINLDSNIWKGENGTRWILQIQSYLKISYL